MDVNTVEVQQKPETRNARLKDTLKAKFDSVNESGKRSDVFLDNIQQGCVVVDVSSILGVFNHGCPHVACTKQSNVKNWKGDAGVLTFTWECSNGHSGY